MNHYVYVYYVYFPESNDFIFMNYDYNTVIHEYQKHAGAAHMAPNGGICYPRVELIRYTLDRYTNAMRDMTVLATGGGPRPILIYE
jgi:hypothetical protein